MSEETRPAGERPAGERIAKFLARATGAGAMHVNSSHHQAVRTPGREAIVNAYAPDGVIEGIEAPGRRFCLGVQWHPEFLTDPGDGRLLAAFVAACR